MAHLSNITSHHTDTSRKQVTGSAKTTLRSPITTPLTPPYKPRTPPHPNPNPHTHPINPSLAQPSRRLQRLLPQDLLFLHPTTSPFPSLFIRLLHLYPDVGCNTSIHLPRYLPILLDPTHSSNPPAKETMHGVRYITFALPARRQALKGD